MSSKSAVDRVRAINSHVGNRIRRRRMAKDWSQGQLGEALGISWQQIQKYEKGKDGVSSGKIVLMAEALGTTVSYFFEDLDKAHIPQSTSEDLIDRCGTINGATDVARAYVNMPISARSIYRELGDLLLHVPAAAAG